MPISILATMKFIVRGKSVDFRNREGSSPSIPTPKKAHWLPNHFSYPLLFFVSGSKFGRFLIYPTLFHFQKDLGIIFFSYHKSCGIYDRRRNEHLWFEQGIPIWMILNPYYCSYWNLQSILFEDSRKEIPLPILLILFFFFNWHKPKSSSKMRMVCRKWSG